MEDYKSLQPLLKMYATPESKVVVLGCGNAEFSEDMYDDGYQNIVNVDISSVVIEQMRLRNAARKSMTYEVMDVRNMAYPDNTFDIAVDKSTIDALLCGERAFYNVALMMKVRDASSLWLRKPNVSSSLVDTTSPSPTENPKIAESISSVLISPSTSRSTPSVPILSILLALAPSGQDAGSDQCHYIYVCKKKPGADELCKTNWPLVEHLIKKAEEEEAR